jgi:hypothetical protein
MRSCQKAFHSRWTVKVHVGFGGFHRGGLAAQDARQRAEGEGFFHGVGEQWLRKIDQSATGSAAEARLSKGKEAGKERSHGCLIGSFS